MAQDKGEPHVTRVVGTQEFLEAWDRLYVVVSSAFDSRHQGQADAILQLCELACRQAYVDGFAEGFSKK